MPRTLWHWFQGFASYALDLATAQATVYSHSTCSTCFTIQSTNDEATCRNARRLDDEYGLLFFCIISSKKMDRNGQKTVLMNPLFGRVVVVVYVLFDVEVACSIL